MGVMKTVYTERQWNETLAGAATSTEIAAMKRLWRRCQREREREKERLGPRQRRLFT